MNLTPRPASLPELVTGVRKTLSMWLDRKRGLSRGTAGFGMVLDRHVPILYSSCVDGAPLGIAHSAGRYRHAVILVFFAWSAEDAWSVKRTRRAAIQHRRANPGHRLVFLCNSAREAELLCESGEIAIHLNHNAFVSEFTFRPLPPVPPAYDAVYNARLAPFKRHALSLEVESCAFIYYQSGSETDAFDAALRERHARLAPGHVFVNRLEGGKPVRLTADEVNAVYNQASVGLCLSAIEGAMFSSMEYMLAGLPIVSTPSLGGRDTYFDDDYCIVAPADPREIRDAVAALKARAIPRDFIAQRALEKVARDRDRLTTLLDALRERDGRALPPREALFGPGPRVGWRPWSEFLGQLPPPAED